MQLDNCVTKSVGFESQLVFIKWNAPERCQTVMDISSNVSATLYHIQTQHHVRQDENNLTVRAEEVVRQTVVQAEALHDEKIKHLTGEAQAAILRERQDKDAAILMAQQSQRRVLELEDAATQGNEFMH